MTNKLPGNFLLYGRDPVVLCVKTSKALVRHDSLQFEAQRGFCLKAGKVKSWHTDLSSLVAHYREPRSGVPYVLSDDESNDIHFNLPNPETHTTTGEEQGVAQAVYDKADLMKLDRRTSMMHTSGHTW